MAKFLRQIIELDEAKVRRKAVSQRAIIKTKGDIAREKSARMKLMKAAAREAKETGEKPSIGVRGNQRSWKAARKSALGEEQLNEISPKKLKDYRAAADQDAFDYDYNLSAGPKEPEQSQQLRKLRNRVAGYHQAGRKLKAKAEYFKKASGREKPTYEETELNEADTISLSVPLFIRMLEYAKEDAKTDMDLHKATERIIDLSDGDDTLDMDSYEDIVGK